MTTPTLPPVAAPRGGSCCGPAEPDPRKSLMRRWRASVAWALFAASAASAQPLLADDFDDGAARWSVAASEQVAATLRQAGGELCMDYDFGAVSGYAALRRTVAAELPADYAFELKLRGQGRTNGLQFKLADSSGDNVWWRNWPSFTLPARSETVVVKARQIGFAWGTASDRTLKRFASIELVVSAARGGGGKGFVCVDRLTLRELPPAVQRPPQLEASAADAALAFDADDATAWQPGPGRARWQVRFSPAREVNGIQLRWLPGRHAIDYDLSAADEQGRWRTLAQVRGSDGTHDARFLPEHGLRALRLEVLKSASKDGVALAELALADAAAWPDANAMLKTLAAAAPRGHHPRAFHNEQNYWTVVGIDGGGARSALLSEDGAIELAPGAPSVEPFVQLGDGTLVSWADVQTTQRLRDNRLPMPAVQWRHAAFTLDVETAARGTRGQAQLLARYTLRNLRAMNEPLTLVLALRPWQVNPPQQFLNIAGGVSPVETLQWKAGALHAGGHLLRPLQAPQQVLARRFEQGSLLAALARRDSLPPLTSLRDETGLASAALVWKLTIPAGESRRIGLVVPLAGALPAKADDAWLAAELESIAIAWRERIGRVQIKLPAAGQRIADTLQAALAQILVSRDGPALQPGTRSYARTWVRDGAMMVAGLLRLGEVQAAREFVDWYAGHLFANGKVPCCVDVRGADPVAENDSHGQFIFAVAELWRHTNDAAWLARRWPQVLAALNYMEGLRQSTRIPSNRMGERASWFGLMPPSISHEGYSDKPAYSYWDDFWALRGYKDAAAIAAALGRPEAPKIAGWRDEFERELVASIRAAAAWHKLDIIPGAADRGDFDATSTTIALNPVEAQAVLPADLLANTFERYWSEAQARREGRRDYKDYTPYELRNVGAFVRLGQRERAHAMLDFFFADQRPKAWLQWAEVVRKHEREPGFVGDMPHAWVSSDYLRSALDLFAYEREADDTLVIGAGLPLAWLDEGVAIEGLATRYGKLRFRARRDGGMLVVELGNGMKLGRGGAVLPWPGEGPLPAVRVDGRPAAWSGRELRLQRLPAVVEIVR
jgi:hypothetical protein